MTDETLRTSKNGHFGQFEACDPFWAPGDASGVLSQNLFYSAQLDMKIEFAAKFQKKGNEWLSSNKADARTHTRH